MLFRNFRISIATKFGKLEHVSARLLGISLVINLIFYYSPYIKEMIILSLTLWIIYFVSHTLEKFWYGSNFRNI